MAGTVRGSIWALGLSGVAVSVASLVAEQPAGNAPPQMPQVAAPAAAVSGQIALDTDTVPPAVTHDYAVEVSRVAAPEAEASAPATDVVPAEPPQTLQLETVQETPAEIDESAVVVTLEEQALDTTSVVQLEIPVADADAVIATQPTAPVSEADQAAAPTDAGTADDMLIITQPTVIPAPTPPVVAQSDAAPIAVPASDELASQPSPVVAEIPANSHFWKVAPSRGPFKPHAAQNSGQVQGGSGAVQPAWKIKINPNFIAARLATVGDPCRLGVRGRILRVHNVRAARFCFEIGQRFVKNVFKNVLVDKRQRRIAV